MSILNSPKNVIVAWGETWNVGNHSLTKSQNYISLRVGSSHVGIIMQNDYAI